MKKLLIMIFVLVSYLYSEDVVQSGTDKEFLFDAIIFKGDTANLSRLDVFVIVPYQTLEFLKSGEKYGNKYDVIIDIYNIQANTSENEIISKVITAEDYFIAQGGSGEYDINQKIFYLPKGDYRLKVTLHDKISDREYTRSRKITILEFDDYDFSLSGIMLLSSIEESGGKYKINPHLSDNVGNLTDNFFAFFEAYNYTARDKVFLRYEIIDNNSNVVLKGDITEKELKFNTNQLFLKISSVEKLATGTYTLKIIAFNTDTQTTEDDYIAVTQRSIKVEQSIYGSIMTDLDNAIRQLRYVAYQDELRKIEDAPDEQEKETRFLAFWKSKDPSPATERNEAFLEYYERIAYANRNFKSYTEGWMTDKGMVYVVYGKPYSIERQNNYNDNRIYEVWRYKNNREYIFVDNTGFGDFRLIRPATVAEKYEYAR